jgi:protein-L-isoaspartate(D-aspartate) O-methyltransferase
VRPDGRWHQANLTFTGPHDAEQLAATRIAPALRDAENNGIIDSWWFVRKQQWRFRYHTPEHALEHAPAVGTVLPMLTAPGPWSWTTSIYEPETYAFGGPAGMDTAHTLFHADSHHVLASTHHRGDRRELSILLLTAMMRAADLDWFEQGDVWARVSDLRPAIHPSEAAQWASLTTAARRLLAADTRPLRAGSLAFAAAWFTAFEQAGTTLGEFNHTGRLTRGLRDLIAHHTIFTWNRHGIATPSQATIAQACAHVIFNDEHTTSRITPATHPIGGRR